jgi:hypothetical protein
MKEAEELEQKNQAKRKKKEKQPDGSERGMGAGNSGHGSASGGFGRGSILGGLSVGSVGSRDSRSSRRATPTHTPTALDDSQSREFHSSRKGSMGAENPYGTEPIADHFSATVRCGYSGFDLGTDTTFLNLFLHSCFDSPRRYCLRTWLVSILRC